MIASITGTVTATDDRSVVLEVAGVGMRIFVLPRLLEGAMDRSEPLTLMTHLHVREDALELYGFVEVGERRLFEELLGVSGVGPRMALGVLSAASVGDLETAIQSGQSATLTKVSGIGTKTAERIIVDLRGKLEKNQQADDSNLSAVIDALVNLGYTSREAREAASTTAAGLPVEQRIKAALQRMGK